MRFVKNEWIKLWNQRSTWIMFILTLVAVIGFLGLNKYFSDDDSTKEERIAAIEEDIAFYEQLLKDETDSKYRAQYAEQVAVLQYRIDNDMPSENTLTAMEGIDYGVSLVIVLVGIFTMVVSASIVSSEFGTGTIKMLLTRPAARWKILLSKLVASILFGLTLLAAGIAVTAIVSYILFNAGDTIQLSMVNGEVVKTVVEYHTFNVVLYGCASALMTILFAFMLGTIFGSSTLAVSLALGIMFMGTTLSMFLAQYDFAKYIWFVNDLGQFKEGSMPLIEGLTFTHALTVNIVYAVIFLGVSFIYFTRRDVTA